MSDKKKLVTLEKETIKYNDDGTQEIIKQEFNRYVDRDKFIQVYLEDLSGLLMIKNQTQMRILIAIWSRVEYNTNRIFLVKGIKEEIGEETGYSLQTVSNSVSALVKAGHLVRESTGIYILNPEYFFKGEIKERSKVIQVVLKYNINN